MVGDKRRHESTRKPCICALHFHPHRNCWFSFRLCWVRFVIREKCFHSWTLKCVERDPDFPLFVVLLFSSASVCCCFSGLIWKIGRYHQRHITIMRNAVSYRFQFSPRLFRGKGRNENIFPSSMKATYMETIKRGQLIHWQNTFNPQKNRFPKQQWCLFSFRLFDGWREWIYRKDSL